MQTLNGTAPEDAQEGLPSVARSPTVQPTPRRWGLNATRRWGSFACHHERRMVSRCCLIQHGRTGVGIGLERRTLLLVEAATNGFGTMDGLGWPLPLFTINNRGGPDFRQFEFTDRLASAVDGLSRIASQEGTAAASRFCGPTCGIGRGKHDRPQPVDI